MLGVDFWMTGGRYPQTRLRAAPGLVEIEGTAKLVWPCHAFFILWLG